MTHTRILAQGMGLLLTTVIHVNAHSEATLRIACLDLRFEGASGPGGTSLVLGTGGGNGEVAYVNTSHDYASGFVLSQPGLPISGTVRFDAPLGTDDNGNGFDDFYEVAQGVSNTTRNGVYETSDRFDEGTIRVRWSRPAGSRFGTCEFTMTSDTFGELPTFSLQFELYEYSGELFYDVLETSIRAEGVSLTQTGNPDATLDGLIVLSRSSDKPEAFAALDSGTLFDESNRPVAIGQNANPLQRGGNRYFSLMFVNDGRPETPTADFLTWIVDLTDENDADGDGIPDLTDGESIVVEPISPDLSIELTETLVRITVSGEAGRTYRIESASVVRPDLWTTDRSISLTETTATFEVERAGLTTSFWRAVVE